MNEAYKNIEELLEQIHSVFGFTHEEKITPNTRGDFDRLPLSIVITWNDMKALEMLISAGADISARGEFGCTPLFHAIQMERYDAAARLVELGADANVRNDMGLTPLEFARSINDTKAIAILTDPSK